MKINGRNYNFGRCIRITFFRWGEKSDAHDTKVFTIEHAPELNRYLNAAIDVNVTDRPSASNRNQPGFMANVTIYNPDSKVLNFIKESSIWLDEMLINPLKADDATKKKATAAFYKKRVQVSVEAGYVSENSQGDRIADYHLIMKGYLNGSSYSRKGVDKVLTFGIYDIDPLAMTTEQASSWEYKTPEDYIEEDKHEFKATFLETLNDYIKNFETQRIPRSIETLARAISISSKVSNENVKPLYRDKVTDSKKDIQATPVSANQIGYEYVTEADRKTTNWFEILCVKSYQEYQKSKTGETIIDSTIEDGMLKSTMANTRMPSGGSVSGNNLMDLIDGLCKYIPNLCWKRDMENVKLNRYVFWLAEPKGAFKTGNQANIKIWNYQNLLDSPAISGTGIMTIKMLFNPECKCLSTIALMLDKKLKSSVTRDFTTTEQILMESMASQSSNLAQYGNIQVTGAQAVAALDRGLKDGQSRGYLFNRAFPIISVEHSLSTYGKNWTTVVKTSPSLQGFEIKK